MSRRKSHRRSPIARFFRFIGCLFGSILFLILFLVASLVAINFFMIATTTNNMWEAESLENLHADYILVLGASLNEDGTPSPMLAERLDTGITLYQLGAGDYMLLSGDGSRDLYYNEARAMQDYVEARGVPANAIAIDEEGLSTYESVTRAYQHFGAENLVIVSQRYHLYRAVYIGESYGLDTYGVPSDQQDWPNQEMREFPARIKDFIRSSLLPILPDPLETRGNALLTRLTSEWKHL